MGVLGVTGILLRDAGVELMAPNKRRLATFLDATSRLPDSASGNVGFDLCLSLYRKRGHCEIAAARMPMLCLLINEMTLKGQGMASMYMVRAFVPMISGCGGQDNGWDEVRCKQFEDFLNANAVNGWRLHSSEYRQVVSRGCSGGKGAWLVCTFERSQ